MPIPSQSQMTLPTLREVTVEALSRIFHQVVQAFNRTPVFPTYRRSISTSDGGTTNSTSSSTFTKMTLATGGDVKLRVRKSEKWTAFDVHIAGSVGMTLFNGNTSVELRPVLEDVASGKRYNGQPFAKMMWAYVDATTFEFPGSHKALAGHARFNDLPPGVYDIEVQWRIANGTGVAFFNNGDTLRLIGHEVIPPDPKDLLT